MTAYGTLLSRQRSDVSDGLFSAVRRLRWSADRLATERERRLREQLAWSAERSPLWRDRLAEVNVATFTEADLPSLPILTKADLMDNFDRALTDPALDLARVNHHVDHLDADAYLDSRYRVLATSGSTGARGLFAYGWEDWVTFVLIATRWRVRSDEDQNASVGTLFASNTQHVSAALHAFFSGGPGARVTHLPATLALPKIVAGLNIAQPTVLQGYPSAMHLLAVEAEAGRLSISPLRVMTCGEQCTAEARDAVRAAWGIEIYDYWGVSEGIYAFPCEAGDGMHLPDDLAIVEPVDRTGKPVARGAPADKILLTNLYNRTQPLIRYEITDAMTMLDEQCACGCAHRRITDIRGRTDSFFVYEGGAAVHWIGMETVLLADPNVVEMQVTQTRHGAGVTVTGRDACNLEALRIGLTDLMLESGLANPEVTVSQADSLERLWSGKLRPFEPLALIHS
jgi:phenylacetate-CoA ligase